MLSTRHILLLYDAGVNRLLSCMIFFILPALTLSGSALPDPPVYRVYRTLSPILIDGRLDDPGWEVPPIRSFVQNLDGAPGGPETEARITWDDSYLYVSFRCRDTNLWATLGQRDEHLWNEAVVEVFIQANPSEPSYLEFEVNPLGALLDIFLIDVRKPIPYQSWNSHGVQWAVTIDGDVDGMDGDRGWNCEIAIPLVDMVTAPNLPPENGDSWRLNLYRAERRPREVLQAWSPTFIDDFHVPDRFATVIFSDETFVSH